jgi:hypothetical protein
MACLIASLPLGDVDVVSVGTAGTEIILAFVDSSLLQQRAKVFELTMVQFEVDNCSSSLRGLLGLDQG